MEVITFKSYYLNKCMYWLLAFWAITATVIFIIFNISREDRFVLFTLAMAAELFFVIYLNRFEPEYLSFDKDSIEITYVNLKSYINYKRMWAKEESFYKNEIKILKKENIIILSNNIGKVAKIRKQALDAEDWGALNNYFD